MKNPNCFQFFTEGEQSIEYNSSRSYLQQMGDSSKQIKFSNLLKNQVNETVGQMEMAVTSFYDTNYSMMQRLRRRSLQPNSSNQCVGKVISQSPKKQENNIKDIINTSKIHRLLLQTQFEDKNDKQCLKKGRNIYVVRKKTDKWLESPASLKRSKELARKRANTDAIHHQPEQKSIPYKIKKRPIFGIEDINISIENSLKKKIENGGLFLSTSTNSILSNTFYSSNKKKSQVPRIISPRQRLKWLRERCRKNDMEPQIITLIPRSFGNEEMRDRKKSINKMYSTNFGSFNFTRSKTEEIEINPLCGWEEQEHLRDQGLIQQNNFF